MRVEPRIPCPERACHLIAPGELALTAHLIDSHRYRPQLAADMARVVVRLIRARRDLGDAAPSTPPDSAA